MNFFGTCDILWDSDSQQAVQYGEQIPVECDFLCHLDQPQSTPSYLYIGYQAFPGNKAAGTRR